MIGQPRNERGMLSKPGARLSPPFLSVSAAVVDGDVDVVGSDDCWAVSKTCVGFVENGRGDLLTASWDEHSERVVDEKRRSE